MVNDRIQRGAYLLRLWDTERVATSASAYPSDTRYKDVKTENKDEATLRERQIWWIERVPGDEENDEHSEKQKYTITHCGSERGLVRSGQKATAYRMHGKPEEHWNFVPESSHPRHYRTYSIRGDSSSSQLTASSADKTVELTLEAERVPRKLQTWELIFPTPSIPTGWFRVRNAATAAALAHRFTHIPPFLIPENEQRAEEPCNMRCCNGNCDKATQWTLAHGQLHIDSLSGGNSTSNRYLLKNRLTGGFLADRGGPEGPAQVSCWSKTQTQWIESGIAESCIWEVQAATPPDIWELRNRATRRVLAEIINNQYARVEPTYQFTMEGRLTDDDACGNSPLDHHPHIDLMTSCPPTSPPEFKKKSGGHKHPKPGKK
ncbi:unnamed protein product [Tuber aestivum]|uniref:Uncharacterized protein n=1 Tax=Tuber aestivum TaxID=59557 RepID=A0A292PY88_9PEZI|nr:unnamed protein product [Tuber aestivum]